MEQQSYLKVMPILKVQEEKRRHRRHVANLAGFKDIFNFV
jgi:hypothetical protein